MPKHRVALLSRGSHHYFRGVMRGIFQVIRGDERWEITQRPISTPNVRQMDFSPFDGVIAHVVSREVAEILAACGKPVINTSAVLDVPQLVRVGVDDRMVGALAAETLAQRGFRHFACVDVPGNAYTHPRREGFVEELQRRGLPCRIAAEDMGVDPHLFSPNLGSEGGGPQWLAELAGPVGILGTNDSAASPVLGWAREAGLSVPAEVAVLGVDNDDMTCETVRPSLSSVALPLAEIGRTIVEVLDVWMSGGAKPDGPVVLPPTGVVERASTQAVIADDPDVSAALTYIEANLHLPISVTSMLDELDVSRRHLERRFRDTLGRTPLQELHRARVARAKRLLGDESLAIGYIASRCGFGSVTRMDLVFRRLEGMTPTECRRRHRPT